jgi:outer membrane protein OmpA-like peptidoglycan-associated protein
MGDITLKRQAAFVAGLAVTFALGGVAAAQTVPHRQFAQAEQEQKAEEAQPEEKRERRRGEREEGGQRNEERGQRNEQRGERPQQDREAEKRQQGEQQRQQAEDQQRRQSEDQQRQQQQQQREAEKERRQQEREAEKRQQGEQQRRQAEDQQRQQQQREAEKERRQQEREAQRERRQQERAAERQDSRDEGRNEVVAPPAQIDQRARDAREKRRLEIERTVRQEREAGRDERQRERLEDRLRRQDEGLRSVREGRRERKVGDRVVIEEPGNRFIYRERGRDFIRSDETDRLRLRSRSSRRERRPNGDEVITIIRRDGVRIITVVDREGRPLRRIRRLPNGREYVLFENRRYRDRGFSIGELVIALPPPRITIPRSEYIVEYEDADEDDIYAALGAPPIERLERGYTLDEVLNSVTLRERMRSVDLNTINFEFGSWEVTRDQARRLEIIAAVIRDIIDRDPDEVFLIEGHTDAVGSDLDNLTLSDRRAEAVARILTEDYGIPPENLVTQGYGEQFLKINTQLPERANRRVTTRRITPLLSSDQHGDDRFSERGGGSRR